METNENNMYGVFLSDHQQVSVIKIDPNEEMFDVGRKAIGCEWIELIEPEAFREKNLVMMIDEEGKLHDSAKLVNCIASYLYETQKHGDPIIGNAVLIKAGEESLVPMTVDEARRLADELRSVRDKAIRTVSRALRLEPEPERNVRDSLMKKDEQKAKSPRRQRCNPANPER